jgi:hypothetical protein
MIFFREHEAHPALIGQPNDDPHIHVTGAFLEGEEFDQQGLA